jgi:hypothetical protein
MKRIVQLVTAIYAMAFLLLLQGCKKSGAADDDNNGGGSNPPVSTPKNIYVAGREINSSGKNVAMYWRNDTVVKLTDGSRDAVARSIFVSGNDVYVAGYQDKPASVLNIATYWKNGVAYPLNVAGTGGPFDVANSIFVSGNDVYAAGLERGTNGNDVAKYWKNGTPVSLTDGTKEADAQSVFVVGNDVYVAGSENKSVTNNTGIAKYWKNGVAVSLTDGSTSAGASAIFVVGNDVYVAGTVNDTSGYAKAVYWKNGVQVTLSTGSGDSYGFAMAVSGNDVFVAGKNGNAAVKSGYWKNDLTNFFALIAALPCSNCEESVGGLAVSGNNIYAAGSFQDFGKSKAIYWKNNVAVHLGSNNFHSSASGIFVK